MVVVAVAAVIPLLIASFSDATHTSWWALAVAGVWFCAGMGVCALRKSEPREMMQRSQALKLAVLVGLGLALVSFSGGFLLYQIPWTRAWVETPVEVATYGGPSVLLLAALAAGAAEEVFFRIGLPRLFSGHYRWIVPTLAYAAVTVATANAALVVMAVVLGLTTSWITLRTGRWFAPILVHGFWTITMVAVFPALVT